jgi:TP901-1 family phage major tail protein
MPASCGKTFLIRIKNDAVSPAFVPMAGLRTKSITFNRELVDVTNSDSVNSWREVLSGCGVRSAAASGSGVANDKASLVVLQDMFFDGTIRDGEIVIPGFGTLASKVALSTFELTGEYNGEITFSLTVESAGEMTFTVEP